MMNIAINLNNVPSVANPADVRSLDTLVVVAVMVGISAEATITARKINSNPTTVIWPDVDVLLLSLFILNYFLRGIFINTIITNRQL
jgi:hypothetical protein